MRSRWDEIKALSMCLPQKKCRRGWENVLSRIWRLLRPNIWMKGHSAGKDTVNVRAEIYRTSRETRQPVKSVTENRNMSIPWKMKPKFLDVRSCPCFSLHHWAWKERNLPVQEFLNLFYSMHEYTHKVTGHSAKRSSKEKKHKST